MRKRILSMILCIVMMLSLVPTVAFAEGMHSVSKGTVTLCDIEFSATTAMEGDTFTVTVIPAEGCELDLADDECVYGSFTNDTGYHEIYPTSIAGNVFTFTMPDGDVTIGAYCDFIEKPVLTKPANLRWESTAPKWDPVAGAKNYEVSVYKMVDGAEQYCGTWYPTENSGEDIEGKYFYTPGAEYLFTVKAKTSWKSSPVESETAKSAATVLPATAAPTAITAVSISGLTVPAVGTTLSEFLSTVKVPTDADYSIMDFSCFIKGSDARMTPGQAFEAGVEYYFGAVIYPDAGYMFTASTAVSTADIAKGSHSVEADAEMGGMTVLYVETESFTPTEPTTPVTKYDVWVGDVQVTSANKNDVLGDGKVSYAPETATLTLNNVTITSEKNGIWADDDLNIVLNGNLTITSAWNGIYGNENLNISGNGDINITNTSSYGINSDFGALSISGSGNIVINSGGGGIYGYKGVSIIRSGNMTVEAKGTGKAGIYCGDVATLAVSGKTTINSPSYGILAITKLEMNAGILDATSTDKFAVLSNAIVIKDGLEITTPASTYIKDGTVFDSVSKTEAKHLVIGPKVVSYDVWVNGEQFTSDKLTIKCGDGTATYDPEKAELTLENATITKTAYAGGSNSGIFSESAITVIVNGTNTIELDFDDEMVGIYVHEKELLKITGDGTLNIVLHNQDPTNAYAVWSYGDLEIKDVTINCNVTGWGLCADYDVDISGAGAVTVNSDGVSIWSNNSDITISTVKDVTLISSTANGIGTHGDVSLNGDGNLTINSDDDGIFADGDITISGSGDVTITSGEDGIYARESNVTISGSGDVTIKSEQYGVCSLKEDLILSGSGKVDIYGKNLGVLFDGTDGKVLLNGTGSPITLSGSIAAKCATGSDCVAGTNFDKYEVTGDPASASVVYTLKAPVSYSIISGANGEWTKGSSTGLSVTSDAPFDKFSSVKVDGAVIAAANYTAEEGSTKITLAPAYLETLSEGDHSIEVVSTDGNASTNFTVKATPVTTGTITIGKSFVDIPDGDKPINQATFTVASSDGTFTRTAKVGDRTEGFVGNGVTGQYEWKLDNVPAGTYTVTETAYDVDGYTCTVTYTVGTGDEQEGAAATADLRAGDDLVITFVDTYVKDVTVTFEMNGHGTQVAPQTFESGEKATKPADPTASGYTFDGWYADATFSAKFDFDSEIKANTTVYAKWTEVKKDEPTKPADPTNPTQPTKPADPTSPQTGDNSHLFLWVALLFISGGALAGTAVYGKKRKYNAK